MARKPLSIGFEEIAADKIVPVELPEEPDDAERRPAAVAGDEAPDADRLTSR